MLVHSVCLINKQRGLALVHEPEQDGRGQISDYRSPTRDLLHHIQEAALSLTEMTNAELLESDCDLLIPAAIENQIIATNAAAIKAPVIVELANGPTSIEADPILAAAGKIVVPDVLANAGGVTVSYFEWVQNKSGFYWDEDEIHTRLKAVIEPEAVKIWDLARDKGVDMRTAAYVHALGRIAEAVEARGTQEYFKPDKG